MKTNLILSFFAALSLLAFTGCSADNEETTAGKEVPKVTLTASCGTVALDGATRTGMNKDYTMIWHSGDVINVNGQPSTQTMVSAAGKMATFVASATPDYYAFYPHAMVSSYDGTAHTFNITLPAQQAYRNTVSFSPNVNPAVAISHNTLLNFYHVCGMLKVPINTNVPATKARFVSMDNPVAGTAIVNPADTTLTVTGTEKTIVITSLRSLQNDTLTWVLPVGTYCAGWRIQLLDDSNNVLAEKAGPNELVIKRGEMKVVTPGIRPRAGLYYAGLYWAKGNLCAPTTTSYTFASAQEECGTGVSTGGYYFCFNTLSSQATASTSTTNTWNATADPCRLVIPQGAWRTPTSAELNTLMATGTVWGFKNGRLGAYFGTIQVPETAMQDNFVFLPAGGYRTGSTTTINSFGASLLYWTSTSTGTGTATFLRNQSTAVNLNTTGNKDSGYTIRCVSDK